MRHHRLIQTLTLVLFSALLADAALAQSNIRQVNAQSFEPSTDPRGVLTVDSAATQKNLHWHAGLYLGYANDPLRAMQDGDTLYKYVEHQVMMDLVLSLGIWRYFELGLHLPVVVYQNSDGDPATVGGDVPSLRTASVGDIRLVPKVRFWRNRSHGFGLAFIPQFTIPTMRDSNTSDGRVSFEPKVVLDYRFRQGTLIALNIGYRLRKSVQVSNLRVDDELFYGLGVEVPVWRRQLSILAELFGAVGFRDASGDPDKGIDSEEAPLEALVGVRYRFGFGLILTGGAGFGLTDGYGSPDFRTFIGAAYAVPVKAALKPRVIDSDSDGDGIVDKHDKCPKAAEDKDGHEDNDGCPDPDNDGDGLCDPNPTIQKNLDRHGSICKGRDAAPMDPEDKDGHEDNDGKPDPDNDGDGLCDPNPTIQRNLDRYVSICKGRDVAPMAPEDKDGHEDNDGKPDPDNDGDGICDSNPTIQKSLASHRTVCKGSDKCPGKKEVINGVKDEDGCPDKVRSKVIVTRKRILILDKIYFETSRARIMNKSHALLRQVASTMKTYPWILKVRIEGHTDDRGRKARNRRLSQRRAAAVRRFLVKQGVKASRLVAKGYGEAKPIQASCRKLRDKSARKACWAQNRRVAFKILKTDKVAAPNTTIKSR